MIQKKFLFFLLMFTLKVYSYTEVTDWKNSPLIVFENKQQAVLKKKLQIKTPFAAVMSNQDQLELKINIFDRIIVYPKSKVQVLEFLEETGFIADFYILDGQVRFATAHRGAPTKEASTILVLKTPFFDLKTTSLADFIINLNMKEPSVEVKLISGTLPLQFFDYEKTLILKAGESVKFVGVLAEEGPGIKYDYLLNNRKVPRGSLGEVQKFDQSIFIQEEKKQVQIDVKNKKKRTQSALAKMKKQKEFEESFLCKKPFAQMNQCAWRLVEAKCYRQRCNVNGKWGDLIERPVSALCKKDFFKDFFVAECDY